MNKIISKYTTALYVDGWLAEFLFFDGENITFKKAHGILESLDRLQCRR